MRTWYDAGMGDDYEGLADDDHFEDEPLEEAIQEPLRQMWANMAELQGRLAAWEQRVTALHAVYCDYPHPGGDEEVDLVNQIAGEFEKMVEHLAAFPLPPT